MKLTEGRLSRRNVGEQKAEPIALTPIGQVDEAILTVIGDEPYRPTCPNLPVPEE